MTCINCTPDNDLWARLIAGEHIVENLNVLKYDFLSYTPTHPWYDHEWGASIFFYLALKHFGSEGLIVLKGILIALTMFFCYKTIELNKPKSTVSYNILYFAIMFLAVEQNMGQTIRCLLFTSLFFSIFLYLLEKARQGKTKSLILLPIIMLFWSNIHGGALSGIGLIGIYCVGEFLNKKPIKWYIVTLLSSLAVLFINPYGIEYVKFLFYAGTMDRTFITEWTSPFDKYYIGEYLKYKVYLVFIILTSAIYLIKNKINYKNLDKTKLLIILAMIYLSVTHIRHISFFVLTTGTLLYNEFYSIFNSFIDKFKFKNEENRKTFNLAKNVIVYFLLLLISIPQLLNTNKEIKITETKYPRFAIEFIKINKIEGNLFINFDWGSYAAYKLYPNNLIVMDGRYEEVYNPDLLLQLKDFHLVKDDWYKIIRDYKTDVMILEKKYPVFEEIKKHKDWKLVFENNLSGVFIPTSKLKKHYYLPIPNDEYYNKTLFNKFN
ncbi:MAG: hypothetical protein E7Z90_00290 [Cyanobacteria bacterium SIG29]|nr:hypothetical protein [Cyanobacteria bacterium SIG29]